MNMVATPPSHDRGQISRLGGRLAVVYRFLLLLSFRPCDDEPSPAPATHQGGGALQLAQQFVGTPFSISTVRQLLRWRCDERGFKPRPIEIIARKKVAPAFEP